MYQSKARHPLSDRTKTLPVDVQDAMWQLFVEIGKHWKTVDDPVSYRSRLQSFMANRIALMPLYADYYVIAKRVIEDLVAKHGGDMAAAYNELFTDKDAAKSPPTTPLALTRQSVSNEFVTLHMALGGFLAFEGKNTPGYFGGTNREGDPPYRPR